MHNMWFYLLKTHLVQNCIRILSAKSFYETNMPVTPILLPEDSDRSAYSLMDNGTFFHSGSNRAICSTFGEFVLTDAGTRTPMSYYFTYVSVFCAVKNADPHIFVSVCVYFSGACDFSVHFYSSF